MTPPRRWFRFSLRTMLVVVTLGCCWLAYQLNWIRERHRLLNRHVIVEGSSFDDQDQAPCGLWLLGERGYNELLYVNDYVDEDTLAAFSVLAIQKPSQRLSRDELNRIRPLFPESRFHSFTGNKSDEY